MSTKDPMTQEQLDAIQARVDAATDGPWVEGERCVFTEDYEHAIVSDSLVEVPGVIPYGEAVQNPADVALIAHAPQDLADLLAEVERLRNDLAKAREVTDDMIERAAVQMCSNGRNATIWVNYLYEDERESFREDARAALDAALNPGEDS